MLVAASCGTGIEDTTHITDRDVQRVLQQGPSSQAGASDWLGYTPDSVPVWKLGKRFAVTDDQARLIFTGLPGDISLEGKYLAYAGYTTSRTITGRDEVTLNFSSDAVAEPLRFATGKVMGEFSSNYTIPFLVDNDLVQAVASKLEGTTLWVKTRIWYDDSTLEMIDGRQFIPVKITQVLPGNKVLPFRVRFTAADNGQNAMLWMASDNSNMRTRNFDALFSTRDLRKQYADMPDEVWNNIVNGRVSLDMTKEQCRLAKGAPKRITPQPDQTGLREYWNYDGGAWLYFQDGILKQWSR